MIAKEKERGAETFIFWGCSLSCMY
jgi:hypothetical protein